MPTMYVAWHKYPTKVQGETTMQTEGDFIASDAVDISAGGSVGNAPLGAEYADIWADAAFYFAVGASPTAAKDKTSKPYPAGAVVQVPNVSPTSTKISGIAI